MVFQTSWNFFVSYVLKTMYAHGFNVFHENEQE